MVFLRSEPRDCAKCSPFSVSTTRGARTSGTVPTMDRRGPTRQAPPTPTASPKASFLPRETGRVGAGSGLLGPTAAHSGKAPASPALGRLFYLTLGGRKENLLPAPTIQVKNCFLMKEKPTNEAQKTKQILIYRQIAVMGPVGAPTSWVGNGGPLSQLRG